MIEYRKQGMEEVVKQIKVEYAAGRFKNVNKLGDKKEFLERKLTSFPFRIEGALLILQIERSQQELVF